MTKKLSGISSVPSRPCIKANASAVVKRPLARTAALLFTSLLLVSPLLHADEESLPPPPPGSESVSDVPPGAPPGAPVAAETQASTVTRAEIPEIEARSYPLKVIRTSQSKMVYLFDDENGATPRVGKILLLKRDDQPQMAFRALKTYPEKRQFAAKRVKNYSQKDVLETGVDFTALEKVADVIPPPPTAQDKADLKELEEPKFAPKQPVTPAPSPAHNPELDKPEAQYDPELDAESSPPPAGAVDSDDASAPEPEEPEIPLGVTIDDVTPIEPNTQALSIFFGNMNKGNFTYLTGGGARFSFAIKRMLLLKKPLVQDSLHVEFGAFLYRLLQTEKNIYNVIPLEATLRYNIHVNEGLGIFLYTGLLENNVFAAAGSDPSNIERFVPAAGVGLMFRIGPSWDARVDLGSDMIGLGLMIGF